MKISIYIYVNVTDPITVMLRVLLLLRRKELEKYLSARIIRMQGEK
jgi:hypothetical protein